jgi:predicted Zn-dependent peptidase
VSKHQLTELPSGERVISERVPGVRSVALGFWIGAGSRDEPEARAGVSHFIEHLLF